MDILALIVFCVCAALLALMLRQYRPEYAMLLSLACGAAALGYIAVTLTGVLEEISELAAGSFITDDMLGIVGKCLAVTVVSEFACQACRDAGENAIASKVELAGKTALVIVGLPLFRSLLATAAKLLSV